MLKTVAAFMTTGFVGMVFASSAFAVFTPEEQLEGADLAIADFKAAHPDHYPHFVGAKFWKSGEEMEVKIYIDHDGMPMEFNYMCHKHDDGDKECHAQ